MVKYKYNHVTSGYSLMTLSPIKSNNHFSINLKSNTKLPNHSQTSSHFLSRKSSSLAPFFSFKINMNPYSKIKVIGKNKSRSMDFSDLITCPEPEPTKTNIHINTTDTSLTLQEAANKIKNANMNANTDTKTNQNSSSVPEDQIDQESNVEHVQGFGTTPVILKRNSSVSSASASALQSAVKRAFSMRRSSSVSERYCRIHDQSVTSPNHDEDGFIATMERTRSVKKKSSKGRIFRACKKLFGLQFN